MPLRPMDAETLAPLLHELGEPFAVGSPIPATPIPEAGDAMRGLVCIKTKSQEPDQYLLAGENPNPQMVNMVKAYKNT